MFLSERKGKAIPCRWTENKNCARTNNARNLEAESIRSRAESTGWCVKLKTVTEIRQSVYLVPHSLLDWEPMEKLNQRCDVVSFMGGFSI